MFGAGCDRFFLGLLNTGFAASAAILVVLVLRLALRRAPKRYSYLLWAPVLLRLLCPFSIESAFSLLPANPAPIPEDIAMMTSPQLDTGFVPLNAAVNALLPAARPEQSANPMQILIAVGGVVWLAGAAGLLLYAAVSALLLRRRLRGAACEGDNVYTVHGLETPFVMGLLRPRIYLPAGLGEGEKGYILLHEKIHLRRGDHLVRLLAFLAVCLHWFNPLVWLSYHLSGQDMEMSCDEAVIAKMGASIKRPYSASLLALASGRRWVGGTPLAFGEGDTGSRIKNVLCCRRPAVWVGVLLAVLVAAVCIGLALNPSGRGSDAGDSSAQSGAQGAQSGSLARFAIFAQDVAGPGDHGIQLALGNRQSQVLELLAPNEWEVPGEGELLETGISPVLTLLSDEGESLDVSFWEEGRSLILLRSADGTKKEFYLAPGRVAQQASAFSEEFAAGAITQQDWVRAILSTVEATPQRTGLVIPQGIGEAETLSVEISALIPRGEGEAVAYTERVDLVDAQKTGAQWAQESYCEGVFPYDDCPDGTELSVTVRFLEQQGDGWIVSSWGTRSYLCEGGEMAEQVIARNTAVTVSQEETAEGTLVTLRYDETIGEGFSVRFSLPQGWTAQQASGNADFILAAPVRLVAPDGAAVGWAGYDLLGSETKLYQPPEGEDQVFYYSTLMLGSVVNWNNEYRQVLQEEGLASATCRVGYQQGGAGGQTRYDWGILARDEGLERFIGIVIDWDALDEAQLEQIARSVRFAGGGA